MPGKAAEKKKKKGGKRRIFPGKTEKRKQVRIIEKEDIKSWNQEELGGFLVSLGEKPFRAKQIYPWLHVKHARTFEEMTDISKKLKDKLSDFEEQVFELKKSGFRYKEIADILDKDVKAIDNTIGRIKNKLKLIMEKD